MIPGAEQVFYIAYGLGAHAVAISGAGPSILAVIDSADAAFAEKAAFRLREAGLTGWQVQLFSCDSPRRDGGVRGMTGWLFLCVQGRFGG